eukprot:6625462-Alexandrium_andersonii.AAC.1
MAIFGPCASDALGGAVRQQAISRCSAPRAKLPRAEPHSERAAMPHSRARDRSTPELNAAEHGSQTPL